MLSILRPLASPLRLPLLAHAYASLRSNILPSTPNYPAAVHILATRHLYDVAYVPPKKNSKKRKADEMTPAPGSGTSEDPFAIRVEGERLVDAVGKACAEYWTVLKKTGTAAVGKKGKGKEREVGPQEQLLWEQFSGWLEEMADHADEDSEELVRRSLTISVAQREVDVLTSPFLQLAYLSANLEATLASAPSSAFLALVKLRNLLRTEASPTDVRSYLQRMIKQYGNDRTPPSQREQVWVARLETASTELEATPTPEEGTSLEGAFVQATRILPYSAKVWDLYADFVERQSDRTPGETEAWYEKSIRRSLLTDALPPADFVSTFSAYVHVTPRELLPRRFVHYLSTVSPSDFQPKVLRLLSSAPTLSLSFLSSILDPTGPELATASSAKGRAFRRQLHERIVAHPEAGADEWLAYAEELVRSGEVTKGQEVVQRARGQLSTRGEAAVRQFDAGWAHVCSAMEE